MSWFACIASLGLGACKEAREPQGPPRGVAQRTEPAPAPASAPARAGATCQPANFARTVALAEASGATWVPASFGLPDHLVVVADSGHAGQFAVIDAQTGQSLAAGQLPLDDIASDDLEGLAVTGTHYLAITSSGFIRHFRRTGSASFELDMPAYGLGQAVECPNPRSSNCHYDFEGLCVGPANGPGPCHGYAASRGRGQLVCLRWTKTGRLAADPEQVVDLGWTGRLAGCAIVPQSDRLLAAANLFGKNQLVEFTGWHDPAGARKADWGWVGMGFGEAVAADPGGSVYRFSDTGGSPSVIGRYVCASSDL